MANSFVNKKVDLTTTEQLEYDNAVTDFESKSDERKLAEIKDIRLQKLKETDYLANSDVTLQVAVIMPEQPISKPFNSLDSEPGRIEKLSIFKFSYKLNELSLTPTIFFGYIDTSFSTHLILNLYPHNFSKL